MNIIKHLTFWVSQTEETCVEMATDDNGVVDAVKSLENILEMNLCKDISVNVVCGVTKNG